MDDAVDRGLIKGHPGELIPGTLKELFPLGLGQMEKCCAGHGVHTPQKHKYDKLSYSIIACVFPVKRQRSNS